MTTPFDYPIGHNIYTFDRFSLAHQNYEFSLYNLCPGVELEDILMLHNISIFNFMTVNTP